MEPKSGSRTIKKSASGAAIGERKKGKQKKKRDKKKHKGTESTDVPSPELDSEVPMDGDVTLIDQDGQTTPVGGQVTRLPQLNSQSSVSLTTSHTSTPPPRLVTAATTTTTPSHNLGGVVAVGGDHSRGTNSAFVSRTSFSAPITLEALPSSENSLEGVVARVANLNIKQRSTKSRSKGQGSKASGKASRAKDRNANNSGNKSVSQNSNGTSQGSPLTSKESLRWELSLEDVEQERERIAVYKMNRRKRYLAAAQAKGLGWALNYNIQLSTSTTSLANPLSEDSGVETATCGSPGATKATRVSSTAGASPYKDFSTMQTLRPITHRALQEAFVEC